MTKLHAIAATFAVAGLIAVASFSSAEAQQSPLPPVTVDAPVARPRPATTSPTPDQVRARNALRRAARFCDGWIGMAHTFESATEQIATLRRLLAEYGREDVPFQMVLGGPVTSVDDVRRWEDIGVTRMIVSPWNRSPEAVEAMPDGRRRSLGGRSHEGRDQRENRTPTLRPITARSVQREAWSA